MQHVVRFTTAEGRDGTHFTETLEEAVAFVERVRNVEEASDVRLFSMTEVPVTFKPYYQAQVGDRPVGTAPSASSVSSLPIARSQPQPDHGRSGPATPSLTAVTTEPAGQAASGPTSDREAAESSVLDTPTRDDSATVSAEQTTPPLESRFGDQGQETESAPANGRRLFSRA